MAVVTLTQVEEDTLKGDSTFLNYLIDQIILKVKYYVGLSSGPDVQTMKNFVYSLSIQSNPTIPAQDTNLAPYALIRMAVRGINKKDDTATGLANQVIAYLNAGGSPPIGFLVDDWFINKTKAF